MSNLNIRPLTDISKLLTKNSSLITRYSSLKNGWWLNVQAFGVVAFAARTWPLITPLQKREEWLPPKDWSKLPPASIIVPARNEETNIEKCVRSLLRQDYPDFEVVVVDDGSSDATPQILARLAAQDSRLKIVRVDEQLPPGWAGKPHAMYNGVEHVRPESEWFLFTDADTNHASFALSRAVATAQEKQADLLSVLTEIEMKSFWEKLLMPIAIMGISLQYPLSQVNSPDSKLALANGQFLLIQREAYRKVGGWEGSLRNSILDDRDMALAVKSSGGRLSIQDGRQLVSVRMYTNLGQIWAGWRKNAFVGSRAAFVAMPFFIVTGFFMGLMPFLQLPYALIKWLSLQSSKDVKKQQRARTGRLLLYSAIMVAVTTISRRRLDKGLGIPPGYAAFTPLSILVFMGILIDSMWRSLSGRGLSWKGRNYHDVTKTQQML